MKKFPKTIAVTIETESDGSTYFVANKQAAESAELNTKKTVAIYELKEVGIIEGTTSYRKLK